MNDGPDSSNLADSIFELQDVEHIPSHPPQPSSLVIKVPPISGMHLRSHSIASGSEYHASEKSDNMDEDIPEPQEEESPKQIITTRHGRRVKKQTYVESSENDDPDADGDAEDVPAEELYNNSRRQKVTRASSSKRTVHMSDDDDDAEDSPKRYTFRKRNMLDGFIVEDEDEKLNGRYPTRTRSKKLMNGTQLSEKERQKQKQKEEAERKRAERDRRSTRRSARRGVKVDEDYQHNEHTSSGASADADGSIDDAPQSSDLELEPEPEPEPEPEDENDGKPYALRQRKEINYAIPPPIEEMARPPPRQGKEKAAGGGGRAKGRLGWSASGTELGRWMGMAPPADDSDSDYPTRTPRKPFGGIAPFGTGAMAGGGGLLGGDLAAGGTPSNLGKIGDAVLADADPLGVNQNVTFGEVGGLDDHIHALKEMTLLPLLYPEVFQQLNVTPPRGVLFHGPPGTGKTLVARALAAECRSGGRQISFFMRKGADCLSKWVGEAERQLRLLFDEARNSQPSIIFFDEIDGLAPVRSSKQDQIHASIVSTLLALMDGMDGRGQVIVIGATNRPDAVDPALRRPGRFDREFYFGLPGLEAREKILGIMTNKWLGWGAGEEEKTEEKQKEVKERVLGLAKLTKGYGGADLRALCTEAALNAIQRRYPQVYKSNDRLLLNPESIGVGLRDFMISIKKLVPSSARSSASAATPLPTQLVPLLNDTLDKVKAVIQRVMPVEKKLTALEEAEFEDEGGEEGALEKEMLSQAMQTLRVYRPRVIIHGPVGMGQGYIGAAALHHLEGYHVQSLELGALLSDSTRTPEAAIVQLFVEAKRNQPSVIYIPSLVGWCAAITETARSTVRAMLDTLAPTDPILLLAVVDGSFIDLPKDVRAWFGPTKENRVELTPPSIEKRLAFFEGLLNDVQRPPNKFADGMERKKRVLEVLPIAPPLEPRKPTAAELAVQEENDTRVLTLLKYRLGPILTELKRKFKRFTKRATEEYNFDPQQGAVADTVTTTAIDVHRGPNGAIEVSEDQVMQSLDGHGGPSMNGVMMEQQQAMQQPPLYDMDLERMQADLFKGRYLTPQDFLDDVYKMVHNADVRAHEDSDRLVKAQQMFTAAQVSIQEFDPQLRLECERMAGRERQRREERRREKGKDKDKEQNGNAAPARRSARNNGLQPEHSITDPVKLERRLKRQRDKDGSGPDSGSDIDVNGVMHNTDGERDAKRTRIIDDEDERDPLDTLGSSRPGTEQRMNVVRFAPQGIIEPMAPLIEVPEMQQHPQDYNPQNYNPHFNPHFNNNNHIQNPYMSPHQLPMQPHPSLPQQNGHYPFNQPQFLDHISPGQAPRRAPGFDPTLLNPVSPTEDMYPPAPYAPKPVNGTPYNFPTVATDPSDPFMSQPHPQQSRYPGENGQPAMSLLQMLTTTPTPPPPPQHIQAVEQLSQHAMQLDPALSRQLTPLLPVASTSTPIPPPEVAAPAPMVVERTPTPLPEFNVSQSYVADLRYLLRERTASLSIEQLEQLRASCLGTVWRHRKEWNRDELLQILIKEVNDFVDEVTEENSDDE
ncbi:AAA-domain-containing protein [Pholiota conissans]|uniref:AAA-domain-containing protein n=1 Tax=Pholiota conissans TaxID=109636 RepID=A0A9P5YZ51_9AGAR|nr:AAA-domain-containing protein [Pholiota conissans]